MVLNKSLDEVEIIAALLRDAHASCEAFDSRSLRLTLEKVKRRYRSEGLGFFTKTMPRLGKHFDQVLSGSTILNSTAYGFETIRGSKLPRFLGELFSLVFRKDGVLLSDPDAQCVRIIRNILYLFYKYELPYNDRQEAKVVDGFKKAEDELNNNSSFFTQVRGDLEKYCNSTRRTRNSVTKSTCEVVRESRILLNKLFSRFNPKEINPSHGPGAVATKQKLWEKFEWVNVSERITNVYPLDEYFYSSLGHVCDSYKDFSSLSNKDLPARVILVPKDSRGPRLISCEPVDFQWVQQGLARAIVELVENHEVSKYNVFFTDQGPNQRGALLGSSTGRYSTLDLKEASDRVSLDLVSLIFPEHVYTYLEACRSLSTVLPSGEELKLKKFAPMGSALCFPVMALTIWALLTSAAPNEDTRERILVYGDDVIVPTAFAVSAMAILESFGLKINQDKSCIQGPFKESCGVDAFLGINVTPVRLRTRWESVPRPSVYTSWIAYANSFYDRQCYNAFNLIVERLQAIYGPIPDEGMHLACPSLRISPVDKNSFRRRVNRSLQKVEYLVLDVESPRVYKKIHGWSMLLRYFTEGQRHAMNFSRANSKRYQRLFRDVEPFSAGQYTSRSTSKLVKRWR